MLVANLSGKARRVAKDGREWLVAPMTLVVPGVMEGTSGPLFYPASEVEKSAALWNGISLVAGHPMDGRKALSVREGDYLAQKSVGVVHNTRFERGKLRADGWFDVERLGAVEPRILADLHAGKPVALSASMNLDGDPVANDHPVHNGKRYTHTTRNYQPDHVGVFAEGPTACSILDGCGVLVSNALSHRTLHERLQALIQEKYPAPAIARAEAEMGFAPPYAPPWVVDVFDRYFVFCRDGDHYRLGYETDLRSDAVSLADESPVEVTLATAYKPVVSNTNPNPDQPREEQPMPLTIDQRREAVSLLVANCNCSQPLPWKGMTQQAVESLDDATLNAYANVQRSLVSNAPAPAPAPQPQPVGTLFSDGVIRRQENGAWVAVQPQQPAPAPVTQPVSNAPAPAPTPSRGRTVEEWIAAIVPGHSIEEAETFIRHNLEKTKRDKAELIDRLTSNMAVGPDRDEVMRDYDVMAMPALERLLAAQEQQRRPVSNNYSGMAGAPVGGGRPAPQEHLPSTSSNHKSASPTWR